MRYVSAVFVICLAVAGCCGEHECKHHGGPDFGTPEPVGGPAATDGQSCDGSYLCAYGLIPVLEGPVGADVCVCRWACAAPDGACPSLDRVCVQLEDENGAAIPGQGSCEPVFAAGRGEPCGPQQCQVGDICAGYSADTAYCRAQCDPDLRTCNLGYDCIQVAEYDDPAITACLPFTGDVVDGGACAAGAACQPGLFCVITAAVSACRPACDPWAPVCAAGAICMRVEDPAMATLGYACVPST